MPRHRVAVDVDIHDVDARGVEHLQFINNGTALQFFHILIPEEQHAGLTAHKGSHLKVVARHFQQVQCANLGRGLGLTPLYHLIALEQRFRLSALVDAFKQFIHLGYIIRKIVKK